MVEYRYPDFMPKEGELVLVRDSVNQEWRERRFCGYFPSYFPYVWHVLSEGSTTGWKTCAPGVTAIPSPVLCTKDDLPMPGQPILVRDDENAPWIARIFIQFSADDCSPWRVMSPVAANVGYRYAAHYNEQFWLVQQKEKEKPAASASRQVKKLAEILTTGCHSRSYCPMYNRGCPINSACANVTKEDWLAWAAKQED